VLSTNPVRFDQGERTSLADIVDVHVVTNLMKNFLKMLPEPLLPVSTLEFIEGLPCNFLLLTLKNKTNTTSTSPVIGAHPSDIMDGHQLYSRAQHVCSQAHEYVKCLQ